MGAVEVNGYKIKPKADIRGTNLSGASLSETDLGGEIGGEIGGCDVIGESQFRPLRPCRGMAGL